MLKTCGRRVASAARRRGGIASRPHRAISARSHHNLGVISRLEEDHLRAHPHLGLGSCVVLLDRLGKRRRRREDEHVAEDDRDHEHLIEFAEMPPRCIRAMAEMRLRSRGEISISSGDRAEIACEMKIRQTTSPKSSSADVA